MEHFPVVVKDLTTNRDYSDIPDFMERFARVLHYTVPNGKKVRGLTTLITYKMLEKPENLTKENISLANILAWCAELLESSILIVDDIVDRSETRRNGPCWYKIDGVGERAVLDAFILHDSLHFLLKKYFSSHPFYVPMVELFIRTNLDTAIGQIMDTRMPKLEHITMERFSTITKYKTGYYTFWFPVTLGMYFSRVFSDELHQQVTPILLEMGKFFQIQNDYTDCFGDSSVTGKKGTDIQEGKITFLSVTAVEKANCHQRKILEEHFGKPSDESVREVLTLYKQLGVPNAVKEYEQQSIIKISEQIKQLRNQSVSNLLSMLTDKLYTRFTIKI
ncbi:hypothetical protein NQ318_003959 [Aromia moschata]|uniref:Farnesyl diphosphate synthase n=1 Tax=Aromia moschata TaxID=1265417 RepID=A0AAV8Z8N9_9CUCU|nr:hypothetical protein NQ318_003959 [Aromia moschata]